jgi:hypothetical protein
MKHTLRFSIIFLPLLFFILTGASAMAADKLLPADKIRIFISGNVQAELGPCG